MLLYRRDFLFGLAAAAGAGLAWPGATLRATPGYPLRGHLDDIWNLPTTRDCLICQKPIEEIQGQMLVYTHFRGTSLATTSKFRDVPNLRVAARLLDDRKLYFFAWGEESIFTDEVIARALAGYLNGEQPWHCQLCGCRQCSRCGKPLWFLACGDYACRVRGEGYYGKGANFGANMGCINPRCKNGRLFKVDIGQRNQRRGGQALQQTTWAIKGSTPKS